LPERFVESILEVKDLQKNYGDFATVKGITYQNQFINEKGRK
jgi:ABC-type histidine transport system ATPase subunit